MLNLPESRESQERERVKRDVIIGLDLAAAAGADKACAIIITSEHIHINTDF